MGFAYRHRLDEGQAVRVLEQFPVEFTAGILSAAARTFDFVRINAVLCSGCLRREVEREACCKSNRDLF